MNKLNVLTIVRKIISDSLVNSQRGEFKTSVIVSQHNSKLDNITQLINSSINNRKDKSYLLNLVSKQKLTGKKEYDYNVLTAELKLKLINLPSAIDFMKGKS